MTAEAPDWLSTAAAELWPEVVEQLRVRDRLEQTPPQLIGVYCQTLARYLDTLRDVAQHGTTVQTERGEFLSAAAKLELELIQRLRLLTKDLGLYDPPVDDPAAADDPPEAVHISGPLGELMARINSRSRN